VVTGDVARRRALAWLQGVLDDSDAMTGTRTMRRARECEPPPRLLPDEEVEGDWRCTGGGVLRLLGDDVVLQRIG
jgi:hypothetical protein